ncbi:MAG: hypothetical protein V4631_07280, partial [Pseudomonadota bacterium]
FKLRKSTKIYPYQIQKSQNFRVNPLFDRHSSRYWRGLDMGEEKGAGVEEKQQDRDGKVIFF